MHRWVFLFPGQGSHYVGMARQFHDAYPQVREFFDRAGDILGMNMRRLCFDGPEDVLVQTENVQPAITTVNLACAMVLTAHGVEPAGAAGHSLGEYGALWAAGVLSETDALQLVKLRGALMQEAANARPGSMAAVMDLDEAKIQDICCACGAEVANVNCPGQVIITGEAEGVKEAAGRCSEAGAKRCVPLNVSGPWHSRCMEAAREKFAPAVRARVFSDPRVPVVSNVDATPYASGAQVAEKLIAQVCSPVLWRQSVERLLSAGFTHFVEVGPKNVLKGLMRRISREAVCLNVENPETLAAFLKANE